MVSQDPKSSSSKTVPIDLDEIISEVRAIEEAQLRIADFVAETEASGGRIVPGSLGVQIISFPAGGGDL